MNTREEIIKALNGERGDTAPPAVFTQTGTLNQMDSEASWPKANFDADKMAELSSRFSRRYGFAVAKVPFCITIEAEALGCELNEGAKDRQPSMVNSPYRNTGGIPDVPDLPSPEEFVQRNRCPLIREAASKISKRHPDLFTIGGCTDPFTVASQLVGIEDFLVGMMIDRDSGLKWIGAVTPLLSEQARLLSECTDDVQFIVEASSEIMPPEDFADFAAEPMKKLISSSKGFTTVHSCGETLEVLDELASLGESGLSVETYSDPEGILERVNGKTALIGGIPPVKVLLQGTPEEIRSNARKYSDLGYSIIAPECGVPPQTSDENLLALSHYRN